MAFPTAYEVQIQRFANALYNLQIGSKTMDEVVQTIDVYGSPDAAFNSYYSYLNGNQTTSQVAETMLANFGLVAGQNGQTAATVTVARNYIVGALNATPAANRGAVVSDITDLFAGLANDAVYGAAATAWNAEITIAVDYEGTADLVAGTELPTLDLPFFPLTGQQDTLGGTNGDDTFLGDVVQVNGAQVNSLGTGDYLHGFGGDDTLQAQVTEGVFMGGGNMPIQPRTFSIENVKLEALFSNVGLEFLGLNLGSLIHDGFDMVSSLAPYLPMDDILDMVDIVNDTSVYVSAKHMDGVDFIGSDHSDADLTIMDLTTEDNGEVRLTSAMTIGMAYSGNSDHIWNESDLHVYFDEDYLIPGKDTTETDAYVWILDEIAWDVINGNIVTPPEYVGIGPNDLLWRIDRFGVTFNFNGADYEVAIGNYLAADYATYNDHASYTAALNAELQEMVNNQGFTELADLFFHLESTPARQTSTDSGDIATIPVIVLTDPEGGSITELQISRDQGATGYFDVFGDIGYEDSVDVDLLISVNVELEKVGRGGDGGELVIGGMNKDADNEWGDGSSTKPAGVEQFDVAVIGSDLLPNSLSNLSSTNNALQVVNVTGDGAMQRINGQDVLTFADLEIGNSNTRGGLDIMFATYQNALKDVRLFDASEFMGDLTLFAGITDEAIDKYLDLADITPTPADDNVLFSYLGGAGNDSINLQIDDDVVAQEDVKVEISTGDGDDNVVAAIMNGTTLSETPNDVDWNWYADQRLNAVVIPDNADADLFDEDIFNNLDINTGAGNDVVWVPGSGDWNITLGSGNDVVYTDNTGGTYGIRGNSYGPFSAFMYNTVDHASWNNVINKSQSDVNDSYRLYNAKLTVEFMGHEVTVNLNKYTNGLVTDLDINQAIIAAVNNGPALNNPGLSAVLSAYQGEANALVIESKIDGDVPAPTITISAPTSLTVAETLSLSTAYGVANNSAAVLAAMNADIATFDVNADYEARMAYDDFGGNAIIGSNGIHNSDNIIEGQTGDDVFVLGTNKVNSNSNSNDTLLYNGAGNGYDCVYNFQLGWVDPVPAATLADAPEVVTLTFGASDGDPASQTIIFETEIVTLSAGAIPGVIPANDVAYQFAQQFTGGTTGWIVTHVANTNVVTLTAPTVGDIANVVATDFTGTYKADADVDPTNDGAGTIGISILNGASSGSIGTVSEFTVSFDVAGTAAGANGSFTFDGSTINYLAGDGAVTLANLIDNLNTTNWTSGAVTYTATTAEVTFTAKANGATAVGVAADFDLGTNVIVGSILDTTVGTADVAPTAPQPQPAIPGYVNSGIDMVDFTSYDVADVYVDGDGWMFGTAVANSIVVWMDENPSNLGEFTMKEINVGANGVVDNTDTVITTIGVLDFGDINGFSFTAANFII